MRIARGAAEGLDKRACRPQESFLVRIKNTDKRNLGDIEPFAQEVDAHEHIEFAETQGASEASRPMTSSISFLVPSMSAEARSILLTTGTISRSFSRAR